MINYSSKTRFFFGIHFSNFTLSEAVINSLLFIKESLSKHCHYVVTPNVDHVVQLQFNRFFRDAYKDASIILPDGKPLIWLSNIFRQPLPERVAGSDYVPELLRAMANDKLTVFLLGARPGVAKLAARRIIQQYPKIQIVGDYSPPFGFENDITENKKIIGMINAVKPQLLILGIGAPKQEIWIHSYSKELKVNLAICAGATIDFLSVKKKEPLYG